MEYANQEILNLGYKKIKETKKWTSLIKKHKVMSFLIGCTICLIIVNGFMLVEFVKILSAL